MKKGIYTKERIIAGVLILLAIVSLILGNGVWFMVLAFLGILVYLIFKFDNEFKKKKKTEKRIEAQSRKRKVRKLIFQGSAGWLLFWLIFVPPIGYIWLLFDMKSELREE